MGDVGTRTNTFWQVFVDRTGSGSLRLATPSGASDNGGVAVSDGPGRLGLRIGVFTSQLLGFSPVASSSDGGVHWTGAVLPGPLAPVPDALAAEGAGPVTSLLGRDGTRVVDGLEATGRSITLTTLSALRRLAPPSCDLTALTAIAHRGAAGTAAIVGGACGRGGDVALFVQRPGGWRYAGGAAAGLSRPVSTAVVSLWPAGGRGATLALALALARAAARGSGSSAGQLVALRLAAGISSSAEAVAKLAIPSGDTIRALGETPGGGAVVLLGSASPAKPVHERIALLDERGAAWRVLPAPPPATLGVLADKGGRIEALVVNSTTLDVYRLSAAAGRWVPVEELRVPIPYGSSG
jgi:hypothetical protein